MTGRNKSTADGFSTKILMHPFCFDGGGGGG